MTSPRLLPDDLELVVSRMPQLEGLWIVELKVFCKEGLGGLLHIQVRKASWEETVESAARVCPALKWYRFGPLTWRIERTAAGTIHMRELDRMENDSPEVLESSSSSRFLFHTPTMPPMRRSTRLTIGLEITTNSCKLGELPT